MALHGRIRTGSDSIFANQDWIRTEKFHSLLIFVRLIEWAMVGLHRVATSHPLMLKKNFKFFSVERTTQWQ